MKDYGKVQLPHVSGTCEETAKWLDQIDECEGSYVTSNAAEVIRYLLKELELLQQELSKVRP